MILRSRTSGSHYGSFNYALALVEHSRNKTAVDEFEQLNACKFKNADPKKVEDLTYSLLSEQHELRHFQDQFGTIAGITLFGSRMQTLRRFAHAVRELVANRMVWRMPLFEWVASGTCPADVRAFYRTARAERAAADAFIGNFTPLQTRGHIQELFVRIDTDTGVSIDAATVRTAVEDGDPAENGTLLFPLGVEVMFEASAHALMRSITDGNVPPKVKLALEQRLRVPMTHEDSITEAATPYMIFDLLISRYMKAKGHSTFARDLVFGVADEILSRVSMKVRDVDGGRAEASASRLGEVMLDVLDRANVDDLAEGRVEASPKAERAYASLLQNLERGGDWDTVADDGSLDADVAIWESFVAQHYSIPLLRLRRATGHAAYRTARGFLDAQGSFLYDVAVVEGRISMSSSFPKRVRKAWWQVALMDEFITALVERRPLACPRAYELLPGLKYLNLTRSGLCGTHIALGCGVFDGGRQFECPNCWFQSGLRAAQFLPV